MSEWQEEFSDLIAADQYRVGEMATIFGVPVSVAYRRAKEFGFLPTLASSGSLDGELMAAGVGAESADAQHSEKLDDSKQAPNYKPAQDLIAKPRSQPLPKQTFTLKDNLSLKNR